jgi:hypothetical protein
MENPQLRSFKNDLAFGLAKELEVVDLLKMNFDEEVDIKNTKDLYNDEFYPYDYEGLTTGMTFELKSRRVKKYQYDTTIVPVSKIRDNQIPPQMFVFNFTDNCSYIRYDKERFSKYKIANVSTHRFGKVDLPKPHYFIPVDDLTDLIQIYTGEFESKLTES